MLPSPVIAGCARPFFLTACQVRQQVRVPHLALAVRAQSYNVGLTYIGADACEQVGTDKLGVSEVYTIYQNLSYLEWHEHEIDNMEGVEATCKYGDTFAVDTGAFIGRSPGDKWTVSNPGPESGKSSWWDPVNRQMKTELFD